MTSLGRVVLALLIGLAAFGAGHAGSRLLHGPDRRLPTPVIDLDNLPPVEASPTTIAPRDATIVPPPTLVPTPRTPTPGAPPTTRPAPVAPAPPPPPNPDDDDGDDGDDDDDEDEDDDVGEPDD